MSAPDPLSIARASLSAATLADDPMVRTYYAACARVALRQLADEAKGLKILLLELEKELARRGQQKDVQLKIDPKEPP